MKLEGKITISRPSSGHDRPDYVRIAIRDKTSHMEFLEVEIDMAEFALALTGLSEQDCVLKTRRLDAVGKIRESQPMTFVLTDEYMAKYKLESYDRAGLKAHLNHDPEGLFHEEGWDLSTYLGTQNSVTPNSPDGIRINTHRVRYVERTPA
jgi:hypothetical protein